MTESKKSIETISKIFLVARWAVKLFLVLTIMCLAYAYYQDEVVYHGNLFSKYLKYYVVLSLGVIFWGVVLQLKDEIRVNIVFLKF